MRSLSLGSAQLSSARTAFGSAHFKFSTHPGWLCHPVPLLLRPFVLETHKRQDRPEPAEATGRQPLWKSNYVYTKTVCTPAHSSASPRGEQSTQCLLVAQLDTAVERSPLSDRTELCGRAKELLLPRVLAAQPLPVRPATSPPV